MERKDATQEKQLFHNSIGNITVQSGYAIVGNNFGSNINFNRTYQKPEVELATKSEENIQIQETLVIKDEELDSVSTLSRNILLIGKTGSGKSTLANILTSSDKFAESSGSTSKTKKIQTGEFIHNSQKYQVIDTVGISDTQLSQEEVLDQLLQAIYQAKNGIHQIFLVISGKLTKEEIATYHLPRDVLFTKDIDQHITIVRTNFPDFQDQQKCEEDREKIKQESKELSDIANSSSIIYVNNPPTSSQTRESSRQLLLAHLTNHPDIYKTTQLDELINQIGNYLNKIERVEIIKTKLTNAKVKPNNKKEIKQLEKDLAKVQQEKEFVFKEIIKEIENKKE